MPGKLYVVSTPIGNLEDITLRAIRILKEVDLIACEDTRVTKKLLSHYQIQKPVTSYHKHNEEVKAKELLSLLEAGKNIALVSDAGTPGISDPGYRLISLSQEKGIELISIPGPSAAIAALSVSGLPTSSFSFFGFLTKSSKKRREFFESIRESSQTIILYESPNRIIETLYEILEVLGDRQVSVSRELTKMFEETLRGKISRVIEILKQKEKIRGEFTIVLQGKVNETVVPKDIIEKELKVFREKGLSLKDTVKEVSRKLRLSKSKVYKEALKVFKAS
ncbi:MAG: 16S rRNA (cytidine(1402)-2'-O)-methyltransferase [Candidatus Dadabacteria bacterium]|nr:16S rRNA (cytidine(1402)-2'-O)-methyltransferase [Candidatus Dadabacteria bacterium]